MYKNTLQHVSFIYSGDIIKPGFKWKTQIITLLKHSLFQIISYKETKGWVDVSRLLHVDLQAAVSWSKVRILFLMWFNLAFKYSHRCFFSRKAGSCETDKNICWCTEVTKHIPLFLLLPLFLQDRIVLFFLSVFSSCATFSFGMNLIYLQGCVVFQNMTFS